MMFSVVRRSDGRIIRSGACLDVDLGDQAGEGEVLITGMFDGRLYYVEPIHLQVAHTVLVDIEPTPLPAPIQNVKNSDTLRAGNLGRHRNGVSLVRGD